MLGFDENLGPALLSLKTETSGGSEQTRVLLRLRTGTVHEVSTEANTSDEHI